MPQKNQIRETNIEDIGIINRGKYIFFIILALVTILLDALVRVHSKTHSKESYLTSTKTG
jgi:hypothetical protein